MASTKLTAKIDAEEVKKELSQLNKLLYEVNLLIDSISEKTKNLTVNLSTRH